MDNRFKEKVDDLNSYITALEKKIRISTFFIGLIYFIIILLFVIYAVVIPDVVRKFASLEEGPNTFVTLIDSALPEDHELINRAKEEIPGLISSGLESLWDIIPNGETILLDSVSESADEFNKYIEEQVTPELTTFLREQIVQIKKENPELVGKDAKKVFNEIAQIHLRETLEEMVKNSQFKILHYQTELQKYHRPDSELTMKELSEKRLLLSFIRLGDDEEYRHHLADTMVSALIENYEKLLSFEPEETTKNE